MTTLLTKRPRSSAPQSEAIPLCAGDHLDQKTFHQRYEAMPASFRAELVKGVVIVPSPLGCPHGQAHARICTWLGQYHMATPGTNVFDNTTTIIDTANEFQPDMQLVIKPEYGGQGVTLEKYVKGAPQLVVEVAATSEAYDLFEKFEVYQQAGVREYIVVLAREQQVRWFVSEQGTFQPLVADASGIMKSAQFPGLWLDANSLFADHPSGVLTTLQAGLADPSHAEFVRQLESRRQSTEPRPA